jgi:hypothetical protein
MLTTLELEPMVLHLSVMGDVFLLEFSWIELAVGHGNGSPKGKG